MSSHAETSLSSDLLPSSMIHSSDLVDEGEDSASCDDIGGVDGSSSSTLPTSASTAAAHRRLLEGQADDSSDPRHLTYHRPVAIACLVAFLLFSCQFLASLSVLPDTLVTWFNHGVSCNGDAAQREDCKSATAHYALLSGIGGSIGAFITFLGSPLLGTISDSYGRRPCVLFCAFLTVVQQFTLAAYAWWKISLYWCLAGAILSAFDSVSILLAFVSDVTPPSKRALCFGFLFATVSGSVIICPFIGQAISVDLCFTLCFLLSVVYILTAFFLLPESVTPEMRKPFSWKKDLNPFTTLSVLTRYTMFQRLAGVVFFNNLIAQGKLAIQYSFMKTRFGVKESFYSWVALEFGVLSVITQSWLLKTLVKYLTNQRIMVVGLIAAIANMSAFSFIWLSWQVFLIEIFSCLSFLCFPAISAMKSNNVDVTEQGKIQGALYGVRQLGGGIGPVLFGTILSSTTGDDARVHDSQLVWYVASGLAILALLIGLSVPQGVAKEEKEVFKKRLRDEEEMRKVEEELERARRGEDGVVMEDGTYDEAPEDGGEDERGMHSHYQHPHGHTMLPNSAVSQPMKRTTSRSLIHIPHGSQQHAHHSRNGSNSSVHSTTSRPLSSSSSFSRPPQPHAQQSESVEDEYYAFAKAHTPQRYEYHINSGLSSSYGAGGGAVGVGSVGDTYQAIDSREAREAAQLAYQQQQQQHAQYANGIDQPSIQRQQSW